MKIHSFLVASLAIMILLFAAKGESNMPMLNWMGRENVTNVIKDVAMKILCEGKSLGSAMGFCLIVLKLLKFKRGCGFVPHPYAMPEPGEKLKEAKYAWCEPGEMFMNQTAFDYYCTAYKAIKRKMEMAA